MRKYRCTICGLVEEFEGEIPANHICPICGATADMYVEIIEEDDMSNDEE